MNRLRLGILGSGKGSNCRAILESIQRGSLSAEPCVVISDVLDAPILEIAREFSVPNAYLPPGQFRTRLEPAVEAELVRMLQEAQVELVALAGFMLFIRSESLTGGSSLAGPRLALLLLQPPPPPPSVPPDIEALL